MSFFFQEESMVNWLFFTEFVPISVAITLLIPRHIRRLYITRRAIELLPADIKPFFLRFADELVVRAIEPDLWRAAGWEDDPNHFLDLGIPEYGLYPFTALPREYGAAVEKFGMFALRGKSCSFWE